MDSLTYTAQSVRRRGVVDGLGEGATQDAPIFVIGMLDAENWKVVLKVYAANPNAALALAYQLIAIEQSLERGRKGIPDAIKGLELAIETLFPHSALHQMGHKLYRRTLEGSITPKQEKLIRKLCRKK